ncbi:MAG: HNH endonuclease [Planctomycetaceae bacterium]|nr:HNH endonuclease [Planctomycetaceae bacterium]
MSKRATLEDFDGNLAEYHGYLRHRLWSGNMQCTYCRSKIPALRDAVLDRIAPDTDEDPGNRNNLILICCDCRDSKGNRSLPEWLDVLWRQVAQVERFVTARSLSGVE